MHIANDHRGAADLRFAESNLNARRRLLRLRVLTYALGVACVVTLASCEQGPRRLSASQARYRCALVNAIRITDRPREIAAADLDGDGIDEEIKLGLSRGGTSYLHIARVAEDRHYALLTKNFFSSAGLAGVIDVTGDGVPELIWWEQLDRERLRVSVSGITLGGGAAKDSTLYELHLGTDGRLLPDGGWAGGFLVRGSFDLDYDGTPDILALAVNTGILLKPRGVWFWDLRRGELSARVPTGATPSGAATTADIDADGIDDLIMGLESPGNGVTAGDWDDGHSYVVALDTDGSILWWNELGGYSSKIDLAVGDLDGDGALEIATVVGGHSEQSADAFRLSVWRGADGQLLAERRLGCSVNSVATISREAGTKLFVGSSDGFIRRLGWADGGLSIEAELDCGDAVECVRVIPMESAFVAERVAVATVKGDIVVLDKDLEPLALMHTGESIGCGGVLRPTVLSVDGEPMAGLMVLTGTSVRRLQLVRRPLPFWMTVTLPLAAILVALGAVRRTRRMTVAWLRRRLLPRKSRGETLDGLLDSLTAASHGKLAATSTLRRLREQFRMLQHYEGTAPGAFRQRFDQTTRDVHDVCLPGVAAIVEGAERLGLVVGHTASLRASVERIEKMLGEFPHGSLSRVGATALGARLDGILPNVEESLVAIRKAAEHERSSDAGVELDRVLSARAPELRKQNADIQVDGRDSITGVRVLGRPGEVSFVLENLIANAIDAVRGQSVRRIHLSASLDSGHVVVRVADTGKGIAAEDHARIFDAGFTDKASGGHGLSLSRDMLSRRGGSIKLVESAPGGGATFEVRFAICRS